MESTENNESIYISDFDSIITLDLRGHLIKVRKYILLNSTYFRGILGEMSNIKGTNQQPDGSYFVDCDEDIFRELLAWLEFKTSKTIYGCESVSVNFNPTYVKYVSEKFGVDIPFHKPQTKKQKEDKFKDNLVKFVAEYIKKKFDLWCPTDIYLTDLEIDFFRGVNNSFVEIENKVMCTYTNNNRNFVAMILKSMDLTKDTFKSCIPEGYSANYERGKKFADDKLYITIKKNHNAADAFDALMKGYAEK